MKEILTPSVKTDIMLEPNMINETTEDQTPAVPIIPSETPPAQPFRLITRSMASSDDYLKPNVYPEFDEATNKTFKLPGDTNDVPISDTGL